MAGMVATVVGIGFTIFGIGLERLWTLDGNGPPRQEAFVEDYLRRAVGEDFLESSDRREIAQFLQRELGLRSRLLDVPGWIPARVEICLLEGRRGAMVVYHLGDRTVTHYLVPDQGHARVPAVAEDHGDLAVVTWASGTAEEALVGAIPASELLAMVRADAL